MSSRRTTIHVCTTCRAADEPLEPKEARAGARLYRALSRHDIPADIELIPVECLSVCKRPVTVGFSAPGKWSYIYGDFPPESSAETILAAAQLYAEAPGGLIPWRSRPDAIKRGVVARIPPAMSPHLREAAE
jgi:predicted metal-binding protein